MPVTYPVLNLIVRMGGDIKLKILENKAEIFDTITEAIQQTEKDNTSTIKNQLKLVS